MNCKKGLDDRCRDENGRIRKKNGKTYVGSLRKIYGETFAEGHRNDTHLSTLLEQSGQPSLTAYEKYFMRKRT